MPNKSRNLLVVVETIFPCTFLWYPFSPVVVFSRPSRQFHLNPTSAVVASAFSPDLVCFYHGFFEVLKAMGVTGRVSCADSTQRPLFSLPGLAIECLSLSFAG